MKIDEIRSMLKSVYIDWQEYLVNPRYCQDDNVITWSGYKPSMPKLKEWVSEDDISWLRSEKQFTYEIAEDGSLIQIYYLYSKDRQTVQSARLAYYGIYLTSETKNKEKDVKSFVNWLRIDYDPVATRGVLHHDCHLHLSGFPNSRIVVRGIPNPRQFVEFIMASFYPQNYEIHRLEKDGTYADKSIIQAVNNPCFTPISDDVFNQMTHLSVPITST